MPRRGRAMSPAPRAPPAPAPRAAAPPPPPPAHVPAAAPPAAPMMAQPQQPSLFKQVKKLIYTRYVLLKIKITNF